MIKNEDQSNGCKTDLKPAKREIQKSPENCSKDIFTKNLPYKD